MIVIWEGIKQALYSLRANPLRSLLTTLGIVIGITTVIAITSVIEGLNISFAEELATMGSNVLYVQKWAWVDKEWYKYRHYRNLGMLEYNAIAKIASDAQFISPMYRTVKDIKHGNKKAEFVMVAGVNEQYKDIRAAYPAAGRFLVKYEVEGGRPVCVLGSEVAESLFGQENPLGKNVLIDSTHFRVVGVLEKKGKFFDMNLDTVVLVPFGAFERAFGARHRSLTIVLLVPDQETIPKVENEIRAVMRRVRKVPFGKEDDFAINRVDVFKQLYEKLTGGLYATMFGVGAISLIVGGIGIMNIMLVSVTERTREIGIRKALGATNRIVLFQFLVEAVTLSAVGGIIGVVLGLLVAQLIAKVSPVPAAVRYWSVLLGLGFSSAVGILFGLWPARSAALKDPIEALRYE